MEEDIQIDLDAELVEINLSLEKSKNFHDKLVRKEFKENVNTKNALHKFLKERNLEKLSEDQLALIFNVCQKAHDACKQNIVNIKYSLSQNS
jgi:hypothetical protein